MLKKHAQLFEGMFAACDLLVVSAAWLLSYWLRFTSGYIEVDKGIPPVGDYLRMLIFVWLIWAFVFRRFGLYRAMRGSGRVREVLDVIRANALSVLILLACTYLFREKSVPFSRLVFVIFWGFSTSFTILSRVMIRGALRFFRRRGYNLRYTLMVGNGKLARKIAARILDHPEYGYELIGFLGSEDDTPKPVRRMAAVGGFGGGAAAAMPLYAVSEGLPEVPVVGLYSDIPELLAYGRIDQIIVALPLQDSHRLRSVVQSIGDAIVDVRIVPDFHEFIQLGSEIEEFDGVPIVSLASTPLCGFSVFTKRLFDLVMGSIFLLISLPVMAAVAALIKLSSKGPVLFSQQRVGLDGSVFDIYKFRTMFIDAESGGARFAVKNDPRVTPLGRVLRKFNIDELPQLINVLQGRMSLVGPRPERPVFIEQFRQHIPRYMLRHKVQAGMTGWAQVNGWRGNTSIEKRIEHDLYYIEHWSLVFDLKILIRTFFKSFGDSNAY